MIPPAGAMTPFLRHRVRVVARDPSGAGQPYEDTLTVGLLFGAAASASAGSGLQPAVAHAVVVIVERDTWRAEFPPALGAIFESDDVERATVQHVQAVGSRWHLGCTQSMRARKA
jgi:hypothetical protein